MTTERYKFYTIYVCHKNNFRNKIYLILVDKCQKRDNILLLLS